MGSKYTKRYTEEFKRDAIALVDSSGKTVTAVARELGISSESLRGWYRKAKADELPLHIGQLLPRHGRRSTRTRHTARETPTDRSRLDTRPNPRPSRATSPCTSGPAGAVRPRVATPARAGWVPRR
ncbi:transposase [Streptomyces griseofuscus]|uniref:transposase n=1 Tax=Streptomyces griseofuscus TaxID=146922 RepID=UPI0036CBD388